MNLKYLYRGNNLLISLCGEIDEFSSRTLRGELDSLIDDTKPLKSVTIDLKAVSFVDSTGLGLIIGRYKKLRAQGAELTLSNVPANIDKVFKTSGVYNIAPKID